MAYQIDRPHKMDALGRIVIPVDLRRMAGFQTDEPLAMGYDPETQTIYIKKWRDSCVICHSSFELTKIGDEHLCKQCIHELKVLLDLDQL